MDSWDGEPDSQFDDDFAQGFIGKTLLVGVTRVTFDDRLIAKEELHGTIAHASAAGLDIALQGRGEGRTWRMPPFLAQLKPARAGVYTLRTTGEKVENPDFVFEMTIKSPKRQ